MLHSVEVDLGGGQIITLESGKMAKQANGAVLIEKSGCRYGLGGGMAHKINVIKVG